MNAISVQFLFHVGEIRAPFRVAQDMLGQTIALSYDGLPITIEIPRTAHDFLFWKPFVPGGYIALLNAPTGNETAVLIVRVTVTIADTSVFGTTEKLEGENLLEAVRQSERAQDAAQAVVKAILGWTRATTRLSELPLSSDIPPQAGPVIVTDMDSGLPIKTGPPIRTFAYGRDPGGKYYVGADDMRQIVALVERKAEIPSAETLLADAEHYARHVVSDFRRAILMAAIACEVKVKSTLRENTSETNRPLVDFALDNQKEVTVTVAGGLFHKLMKAALGRSLSEEDNRLFRDIEKLYKIRNDIAHRGIMPDETEVRRVVRAARQCFIWLDSLDNQKLSLLITLNLPAVDPKPGCS